MIESKADTVARITNMIDAISSSDHRQFLYDLFLTGRACIYFKDGEAFTLDQATIFQEIQTGKYYQHIYGMPIADFKEGEIFVVKLEK